MPTSGQLIILSGPSGAGKSTVVRRLIEECPLPLQSSISATTRQQRKGEKEGEDYHFISHDTFEQMRNRGEFLECKEVFGRGDWYGTPSHAVDEGIAAGKWMILEIDVQGAMAVLKNRPSTISIFVHPGSLQELENRLRRRGTDTEEAIQRRLEVAAEELKMIDRYKFEIINREVEQTVAEICQILQRHN